MSDAGAKAPERMIQESCRRAELYIFLISLTIEATRWVKRHNRVEEESVKRHFSMEPAKYMKLR